MDLLMVPRTDTPFGLRRFSVAGPRICRDYHMSYGSATHFRVSSLKTHYFCHHMEHLTLKSRLRLRFYDEVKLIRALNKFMTDTDTDRGGPINHTYRRESITST